MRCRWLVLRLRVGAVLLRRRRIEVSHCLQCLDDLRDARIATARLDRLVRPGRAGIASCAASCRKWRWAWLSARYSSVWGTSESNQAFDVALLNRLLQAGANVDHWVRDRIDLVELGRVRVTVRQRGRVFQRGVQSAPGRFRPPLRKSSGLRPFAGAAAIASRSCLSVCEFHATSVPALEEAAAGF